MVSNVSHIKWLPDMFPSRLSRWTHGPSTHRKMCMPCIFFLIKTLCFYQITGAKKYCKLNLSFFLYEKTAFSLDKKISTFYNQFYKNGLLGKEISNSV